MSGEVFLYKLKNSDNDRDACCYIDTASFECGHYFHVPRPCGPCYTSSGFADYDNIETVLTKKEYSQFLKLCDELNAFGGGLDKDEEKKAKAQEKANELNSFISHYLWSEKAEKFAKKIQFEEDEWLKEEYDLDDEDIELIHDTYGGNYFDRAIVGRVYNDSYEVAEEYLDDCCSIEEWIKNYIDYDKMGDDLINDGYFAELSDGRYVSLNE